MIANVCMTCGRRYCRIGCPTRSMRVRGQQADVHVAMTAHAAPGDVVVMKNDMKDVFLPYDDADWKDSFAEERD